MGAQCFTAVCAQRALRHVGISEPDYAMRYIYLKRLIPPPNAPNQLTLRVEMFEL